MLTLQLFGNPQLKKDEVLVRLGTRKGMALAAYLAVTGKSQNRDTLITLLWPELDQRRGRAALRSTLSALKKGLEDVSLAVDGEQVYLDADVIECDVVQFRAALAKVQSHSETAVCDDCLQALKTAVVSYHDDFMRGFSLKDSVAFDDWQFLQAEQLREQMQWVLRRLIKGLEDRSQFEEAVDMARRCLTLDPLLEDAHQTVMRLYGLLGQTTAVQRQYDRCVALLQEELGVEPSSETVTVFEQAMNDGKRGESNFYLIILGDLS